MSFDFYVTTMSFIVYCKVHAILSSFSIIKFINLTSVYFCYFFLAVLGLEDTVMKCFCSEHCPEFAPNNTCYLRPGGWCFAQLQSVEPGSDDDDVTPIL